MNALSSVGLFPFCVDPQDEFTYFKGSELETIAVPMWWRVKKWSFSLSIPPLGSIDEVLDVTNQSGIINLPNYQTETDLVCGSFDHVFSLDQLIPYYGPPRIHIGPLFDIEIDTGGETNPLGSHSFEGYVQKGTVQIIIGGANINITRPMYSNDPEGYSAFAIFEAIEYWPYDPKDGGGPIYNSQTGARLRNPLIIGGPPNT